MEDAQGEASQDVPDAVEILTREVARDRGFVVVILGRLPGEPLEEATVMAIIQGQPRQTVRGIAQRWIDGNWPRMRERVREIRERNEKLNQRAATTAPAITEEPEQGGRSMLRLLSHGVFAGSLAWFVWSLIQATPHLWPWLLTLTGYALVVGWLVGRDTAPNAR